MTENEQISIDLLIETSLSFFHNRNQIKNKINILIINIVNNHSHSRNIVAIINFLFLYYYCICIYKKKLYNKNTI